jgi:hypothetical protein
MKQRVAEGSMYYEGTFQGQLASVVTHSIVLRRIGKLVSTKLQDFGVSGKLSRNVRLEREILLRGLMQELGGFRGHMCIPDRRVIAG